MRASLTKRLAKLEQALPSKAKAESYQSRWLQLFEEFGVPPDTPIPDELPIVIEFIEPKNRSVVSRMLPLMGKMLKA